MTRLIYTLLIAGLVITLGLLLFPSIHPTLNAIDTTGFSYLLTAGVTALPYILVGAIIYGAYKVVKG